MPAVAQTSVGQVTSEADIYQGTVQTADPIIRNAMLTLPDAVAKWKNCYRGCMAQQECTARICASKCEGQVVAQGYAASQTADILRYNVMGIYGAECIGDFRKYIDTIRDAAKAAHLTGLSALNVLATVIVDKILDAVISQILNNLTNQICNVTNQITEAANSFVQNAICLPNLNINPFNFNLNIKNLQCDGFSINPLTGQVNGAPINGVNVPITNIYDSGAVSNPSIYGGPPPINNNMDLPITKIDPLQVVKPDPITLPTVSPTQ